MEVFDLTSIDVVASNVVSAQELKENRMQTLKSLTLLLLNELNLLESLNRPKDGLVTDTPVSLSEEVEKFEIELIRAALIRSKGSQRVAARMLRTKTSTLCAKIKRYGIEPNGLALISVPRSVENDFTSERAFS